MGSAHADEAGTGRDEEVDEVDAEDRFVRRTTRSRVRRENLWHRCVWIFVCRGDGRLFIHQRTATKDVYPAFWDVAAGGVLGAGEDYDDAARREVGEELGVRSPVDGPLARVCHEDADNRVVGRVYMCRFDGEPVLQAEEVQRGAWVTAAELAEAIATRDFCPDGLRALAGALGAGALFAPGSERERLEQALVARLR